MNKVVSIEQAFSSVKSGMTMMVGGNIGKGFPGYLVNYLLEQNIADLTIITSDISLPECGVAKLIGQGKVKTLITTHIWNFPVINSLVKSEELEVIIVPRGTLTEYIRAARAAPGGNASTTGAGSADQQKLIRINGRDHVLQVPFKAEVALIKACKSDYMGNLFYRRETRNFNPIMAAAAQVVIAETDIVVDSALDSDEILTPGAFIKYVVKGQANNPSSKERRK